MVTRGVTFFWVIESFKCFKLKPDMKLNIVGFNFNELSMEFILIGSILCGEVGSQQMSRRLSMYALPVFILPIHFGRKLYRLHNRLLINKEIP